jgi:hypothetical protein
LQNEEWLKSLKVSALTMFLQSEIPSRKAENKNRIVKGACASLCDIAFWQTEFSQARATSLFGKPKSRKLVRHRFLANRNLASFPYDSF